MKTLNLVVGAIIVVSLVMIVLGLKNLSDKQVVLPARDNVVVGGTNTSASNDASASLKTPPQIFKGFGDNVVKSNASFNNK